VNNLYLKKFVRLSVVCYKCKCVISARVLLKLQILSTNKTAVYKTVAHVFVKFINPIFVHEYKSVYFSVFLKCETVFSKNRSS
jgi:hypothetical protein